MRRPKQRATYSKSSVERLAVFVWERDEPHPPHHDPLRSASGDIWIEELKLNVKAVANSRLSLDKLRMGWVGLQFLAQLPDKHPEILCVVLVGRAPDGGKQGGVADHLAGVAGQVSEDVVFLGR